MKDLMQCSCGGELYPVRFYECERTRENVLTGRVRLAVSHLQCNSCMRNACIDDSMDGPWRHVDNIMQYVNRLEGY